jgi:hypothetical protein
MKSDASDTLPLAFDWKVKSIGENINWDRKKLRRRRRNLTLIACPPLHRSYAILQTLLIYFSK